MEINGRKQEPVRLGTHGENYGNWMSAPVFYMVGALVVLMAALCVISHFIPGMRLLGVLAEGKSIRYLTPQVVVDHVMEHEFYREGVEHG